MRTKAVVWLVVVGLLTACVAIAGEATLKKCLPASNDISGWSVVSGTYKFGEGSGIADIYNGGYEKLIEAGMKCACVQHYKNGSRSINVYCNEFESAAKASSFYAEETKEGTWTSVAGVSTAAKYKKSSSVVVGHIHRGKVHAKVVAVGTSDEQVAAVQNFLKKISARIAQNY